MEKKLVEMNFKAENNGLYYLAEAVKIKKENKLIRYCEIYKKIAEKYNVTYYAVERCLRYCIRNSNNLFKLDTVSNVISRLAILL